MKHVYGPIPSRRLGRSLGIDPIPFKTCNWNCVYCQLGRTSPLTGTRRDYFPPGEIVGEVNAVLTQHRPGDIDWLTFVGSGEPTLHASLGHMIRELKTASNIPVAVITNGSLLHEPSVRGELAAADAVLPSLDAGSQELYLKINRPVAELDFEQFIDGLVAFRDEFHGKYWVEVMLLRDVNDSETALNDLARVLKRVRPDEVHINLPIRPPGEPWVQAADTEGLTRAQAILGRVARIIHPTAGEFDLTGFDSAIDAVVAVIQRHPMTESELLRTLDRLTPEQVGESLGRLRQSGKVQVITRQEQRFWAYSEAAYVGDHLSRCHGAKRGNDEP